MSCRGDDTRPGFLYFMRDRDGDLLYIGITVDVRVRLLGHLSAPRSHWFPDEVWELEVHPFPTISEAHAAEVEAIRELHPRYNLDHNQRYETQPENARLNLFADVVLKTWGFVPLSVRYEAARAADAIVAEYMATGRVLAS